MLFRQAEPPLVAQRFFIPDFDENHEYDVIVIGSGAGGGVAADQAEDYGLDVLVLEPGSYAAATNDPPAQPPQQADYGNLG